MLSLSNLEMRRDPYPIGLAKDIFDPDAYKEMIEAFPSLNAGYVKFKGGNNKYSLSEVNNPIEYRKLVFTSAVWKDLFKYIKGLEFISYVITILRYRGAPIVDD